MKQTPSELSRVIKAPSGEVILQDVETKKNSSELQPPPGHATLAEETKAIDVATKGSVKQTIEASSKLPAASSKVTGTTTPLVKQTVLNEEDSKLLKRFNPFVAPIMGKTDPNQPARVRMLLLAPKKARVGAREGPLGLARDEMVNIVLDGLKQSPYFEALEPTKIPYHTLDPHFVLQEQNDVVWVVDAQTLALKGSNYSVVEEVLVAAKATVNYQQKLNAKRKPSLKVVFFDYHDRIAGRNKMCGPALKELVELLGYGNVRDVVGKVVVGRHWDESIGWQNQIISSLNGFNVGGKDIAVKAETVSEGGSIGRTEVSQEYVESVLPTKIVVVTQRDAWEDHFRLFEALAGGAMVMTDAMLSLPDGLVDGESVVMFKSREELRVLLLYYLNPKQDEIRLAIARKGFKVAMGHHRSYHRMEEVFFGKQLSLPAVPPNRVIASTKANGPPPKRPPRKKTSITVVNKGNVRQNTQTNT